MADPDSLAEGFTEGFASQLSTSLFHDFVLKCEDGHELKVHRMILQPNEAAVKPIFRVSYAVQGFHHPVNVEG